MAEGERLTFDASPGGARFVEVTWIQAGGAAFGRDRTVQRAEAAHAKIVEVGGTNAGSRVVSVVDANAYVAEIERFLAERAAVRPRRPSVVPRRPAWSAFLSFGSTKRDVACCCRPSPL